MTAAVSTGQFNQATLKNKF